jgi:hypothetical protein
MTLNSLCSYGQNLNGDDSYYRHDKRPIKSAVNGLNSGISPSAVETSIEGPTIGNNPVYIAKKYKYKKCRKYGSVLVGLFLDPKAPSRIPTTNFTTDSTTATKKTYHEQD